VNVQGSGSSWNELSLPELFDLFPSAKVRPTSTLDEQRKFILPVPPPGADLKNNRDILSLTYFVPDDKK